MAIIQVSFILILSVLFSSSLSLNILGIFPHPGNSHFRVFEPLLRGLAEKGHTLTVISPFPQKKPIPRYTDISLQDETDIIFNTFDMNELGKYSIVWTPFKIAKIAKDLCLNLRSKPMQDFFKSDVKFDLILTEMFCNDCYLGFVHKYKIPFIGLCPNTIMPWSNKILGNPFNPSYMPMTFAPFSDRMTFWQRLDNTIGYITAEIIYKFLVEVPNHEEAKIHFGDDLPPLTQIANNISLMLVNSHFSLNLPRPFVPNIIEVGGMFVENQKKIPEDIEKFISESKDGVIYFSMGSMIKGHTFPEEKRKAFFKVFSNLKQRILWKWETDSMPDKPRNVMIRKWMPQGEILCHPNVIAFISHGGLLSTIESVHCGKPVVVLPQYGDQFLNSKALEVQKAGIVLNMDEITEETIAEAVRTVLQESFRKNAENLSKIFRDRPSTAMETAVYWVEYVARHNGAPHLRSAAVDLPFYQYFLLDVILFICGSFLAVSFVLYYLLRLSFCVLFKRKVNISSKSEKVKKH